MNLSSRKPDGGTDSRRFPSVMTNRFAARLALVAVTSYAPTTTFGSLLITGIIDGPRSGGTPKAVELYATADISDLSAWNLQYYFNANQTPSVTVTLTGSASAGDYIYVANESTEFTAYFGFAPNFTGGGSINGNDSVVLRESETDVDVFGSPGTDGTGKPWEYLDSWFYRVDGTLASTTWTAADWTSPGVNALDPLGATGTNPASGAESMPIGVYVPEPSTLGLAGAGVAIAGLGCWRRRRSGTAVLAAY